MNHFAVQKKVTQHCKATILQSKQKMRSRRTQDGVQVSKGSIYGERLWKWGHQDVVANRAREGEQELPLKPLGAKQRSPVFILKSIGNIEGF